MGLLKNLDPLLTADVLHILRSMGHGDKLCICDCNFPATSTATQTTTKKCALLTSPLPQVLSAICSVFPLDYFSSSSPISYMAPQSGVTMPPAGIELNKEIHVAILRHNSNGDGLLDAAIEPMPIERFAFYEEAKTCFAVIQTMERRPYGNVILTKGVVGPDGKDLKPTSNI